MIGDDGRHRLDAGHVHLAKLLHPAKNIVEFRHQRFGLIVGDGDAGEAGDLFDSVQVHAHAPGASTRTGALQADKAWVTA